MNRNEVTALVRYLDTVYPNNRIKDIDVFAITWTDILKPYDRDQIMAAARMCVKTCKFFPSVSEIIDRIIPSEYEKKGIPEEPVNEKELNEKIDRAVESQKRHLQRSLSDSEYHDIRDEIITLDEMRRKYTRPFEFERSAK